MVRAALVVGVLLLGCSSGAGAGPDPERGGGGKTVGADGKPAAKKQKGKSTALAEITFPTCAGKPCVLHRGTRRYHSCLLSVDGKCAHFGASCEPDGGCMFDLASKSYRACSKAEVGRCLSYGAPCKPKSSCQVDPKDGLYRVCAEPAAGRCKRFGAVCAPDATASTASAVR